MSSTLNLPNSVISRAESSSSCVTATPDKNGHVPPGSCNSLYSYYPSFTLAIVFTALFLLTTVGHVFQAFYHKKRFCFVIIMGSLWEFISFLIRIIGTKNQQSKLLAAQSFVIFALAPLWINAFVYMVAGRLIYCFHPEKRVFKFKAISIGRIFILSDIFAFLVQFGGASMISPGADEKLRDTGLHVYQAGIGIQQVFIIVFVIVIIGFHRAMLKMEQSGWRDTHQRKWKLMVWVLYFVLLMITVRIAYRLAEFLIPFDHNPLFDTEIYMYVLDAVPMFIALVALNIVHPGRILVGPESNYRQGKKQLKAERKAAKKATKARKKGGVDNSSDDEEEASMIGMNSHTQGTGNSPYIPLSRYQEHGVVGSQQSTLYDPYYGRSQGVAPTLNV